MQKFFLKTVKVLAVMSLFLFVFLCGAFVTDVLNGREVRELKLLNIQLMKSECSNDK